MAVKQLPKISDLPEPPDRLVGDQERFDVLTFNSLKAQKKMVNDDLNKTLIPALNEFAVDVNASVDAAALSERNAHDSEEVAKRKAGEASGSAGAAKVSEDNAKVSETNALASKNAAASSATAAQNAKVAAEAARDEAQDLANVGYASESHAGLSKVDGKTTQADAGGVITVKDVAIGGDLEDLASARGQVGDARQLADLDFNMLTVPGFYRTTGNPQNGPIGISGASIGSLFVSGMQGNGNRLFQIMVSGNGIYWRTSISGGTTWEIWNQVLTGNKIGDGIRNTNGIISVPEMQGATASTAGTSGLVPPATAGQQESFLTGGGEYKPALTKISDSVSLADSTTAASATAAKAAYARGTEALNGARQKVSKTLDDATGVLPLANGGTGRTDGQCPAAQALLLNGTFGGVQAKLLWSAQDAVTYLLGANPEGTGLYPILPNKVVVGEAITSSICKGVFTFTGNHPQYLPSAGTWKGFTCPAQSGDLFFCGVKSGGDAVTNPTGALQYGIYVRTA